MAQTLLNKDVFQKDPTVASIPNLGVAKVGEPQRQEEWDTLRFELTNFVCEGEYERGLDRVLSTFLQNLDRPQQPAVWVSGFYGSGKSHFARVLEALWRDTEFPDGARARGIVTLPKEIEGHLRELTTAGRRAGGLWSAAGMLSASAGDSVRLAMLSILFHGAGLPPQYARARFVVWLRNEGYETQVRDSLARQGRDFEHELKNMNVSPALASALIEANPQLADTPQAALQLIKAEFPSPSDISDGELVDAMGAVLALKSTTTGKVPLTLLVFDELQQFIGEDPTRTLHVQQIVEACSSRFGSSVLFLGTGQAALQGTPQLQKLQGRFTVRVTLEDKDVEHVVREVVLRKAPDKIPPLDAVLERTSGEISRHLVETNIAHGSADGEDLVPDYPLLPTRRRFWERTLRAVDSAGTAGQLRAQLRIVQEATRDVALKPLGTVVGGDVIYDQLKGDMLQSGALLREVHQLVGELDDGTDDGRLRARLAALIFLIGKLPTDGPAATGLRPTTSNLADLLVEDLTAGSTELRQRIPLLLQGLVEQGKLQLADEEYRLQTREGMVWEQAFREHVNRIVNDDGKIAHDRTEALKKAVAKALEKFTLVQGESKTPRKYELHFGADAPATDTGNVPVWIRDEWLVSEKTVREDARAAGVESAIVFISLPRRDADALKVTLARVAAAEDTLNARGTPTTEEGRQARDAMRSRQGSEQAKLDGLIAGIVAGAKVFQGGGNEVVEGGLRASAQKAIEASLSRLFPQFRYGDHLGWGRVVTKAIEGAGDALSAIGYKGDVADEPACREVRKFVGGSPKKGSEVRKRFTGVPYGWPQDAADGALLALTAAGILRAARHTIPVPVKELNKQSITSTDFVGEDAVISKVQLIALRSLLADLGFQMKPSDEEVRVNAPLMLKAMVDLAGQAGGEPPLPLPPSTDSLREHQALAGNAQLVAIYEARDRIRQKYTAWMKARQEIGQRLPRWETLQRLLRHAGGLPTAETVQAQVAAIVDGRALLAEPDPVSPLRDALAGALRTALQATRKSLLEEREAHLTALLATEEWQKISEENRQRLQTEHGLGPVPEINVGSDETLLRTLDTTSLAAWRERQLALPGHVAAAREAAAKLLEPESVTFRFPTATLRTASEVNAYLDQVRDGIMRHIDADCPVIV